MVKIILGLILLSLATASVSQENNKVLIIDKLIIAKAIKEKNLLSPLISLYDSTGMPIVTGENNALSEFYRGTTSSNYILSFPCLSNFYALGVQVDDKGGIVLLKNLNAVSCGDTIRIKSWKIYHNTIPDTVRIVKYWQGMINDSIIASDTSVERRTYFIKHGRTREIPSLRIEINKQEYDLKLTVTTEGASHLSNIHGYKPLKIYNRYQEEKSKKIDNSIQYKYSRFSGRIFRNVPVYRGQIVLRNN